MKKYLLLLALGFLSVFVIFGSSLAWQGRMAGMNDPYGLVQDESDMLIHPAMIMNSSGTRFYTHYRFTYTDVMDWDYKWNFSDPSGPGELDYGFKASGDEYKHEALIGSTYGLGSGRMGVFFTYENQNGEYDGEIDPDYIITPGMDFDLESDKNDFTLSLLYGFPIDCIDIGFEAGFAYHNEENKTIQEFSGIETRNHVNFPFILPNPYNLWSNIYTYMIPYDFEYYETFVKASIASEVGCNADFSLTINGGYIFSGYNELDSEGTTVDGYLDTEMDGDVDGWSLGGDFWLRYRVDDSLSLPFLVSASYQEKIKAGDDSTILGSIPVELDYEHKEVSWSVEAGGGVDIALDNTSKIASGIYYQYSENNNDFLLDEDTPTVSVNMDMNDIPDYDEHRIALKIAYEKNISPMAGFRAGFDCFYGWADWDYKNDFSASTLGGGGLRERVSMDGAIWGIGLTIGGTIKIDPVTLEPFIGFAYQQTDLDGDGTTRGYGFMAGIDANIEGESERDQWLMTTGLSILF
jgi:hypothetical protein